MSGQALEGQVNLHRLRQGTFVLVVVAADSCAFELVPANTSPNFVPLAVLIVSHVVALFVLWKSVHFSQQNFNDHLEANVPINLTHLEHLSRVDVTNHFLEVRVVHGPPLRLQQNDIRASLNSLDFIKENRRRKRIVDLFSVSTLNKLAILCHKDHVERRVSKLVQLYSFNAWTLLVKVKGKGIISTVDVLVDAELEECGQVSSFIEVNQCLA